MGTNTLGTALDTFIATGGPRNLQFMLQKRKENEQRQALQNAFSGLMSPTLQNPVPVGTQPGVGLGQVGGLSIPNTLPQDLGGVGPQVQAIGQPRRQVPLTIADQQRLARQEQMNFLQKAMSLSQFGPEGAQLANAVIQNASQFLKGPASDTLAETNAIVTSSLLEAETNGNEAGARQLQEGFLNASPETQDLLRNNINPQNVNGSLNNLAATLGGESFLKLQQESALTRGNEAFKSKLAREEKILSVDENIRQKEEEAKIKAFEKKLPEKPKQSDISGMRKEFTNLSGEFIKVRDAFDRIHAVSQRETAAGDLALIFNFMKMQDPASVVRESEFATAEQARAWLSRTEDEGISVPSFVIQAINKLDSGQKLLPEQRKDFVDTADALFQKQSGQHEKRVSEFSRIADEAGIPKEQVIVDFTSPNQPSGQTQSSDNNVLIQQARDAIAQGADRGAVIQRLQQMGVNPEGL